MQQPQDDYEHGRLVEMVYRQLGETAGYLCWFCGHWGENVEVDACEQCTYPLDLAFAEEVVGFADLFRKDDAHADASRSV